MTTEYAVALYGHRVPITDEALEDARRVREAVRRYADATPEQREAWARESAERRAAERQAATPVPFTVAVLLSRLSWTREYAEHLVQPYCECYDGMDGWEYCEHARDLGLVP